MCTKFKEKKSLKSGKQSSLCKYGWTKNESEVSWMTIKMIHSPWLVDNYLSTEALI